MGQRAKQVAKFVLGEEGATTPGVRLKRWRIVLGEMEPQAQELYRKVTASGLPGLGQTEIDAERIAKRYAYYKRIVDGTPDDNTVIWHVTAPVIFGHHGGPDGTAQLPIPDGYYELFDPSIQHLPDADVLDIVAEQLGEATTWDRKRWNALWSDIGSGAAEVAKGAAGAATAAATTAKGVLGTLAVGAAIALVAYAATRGK